MSLKTKHYAYAVYRMANFAIHPLDGGNFGYISSNPRTSEIFWYSSFCFVKKEIGSESYFLLQCRRAHFKLNLEFSMNEGQSFSPENH